MNVSQYCCAGLNFGYYYDKSPLIDYDGEQQPAYTMGSFQQSTVPGCRLPHAWLSDGKSLYDVLGTDYTLLKINTSVDTSALEHAATSAGLPLAVRTVDILGDNQRAYDFPLLIIRPDQHIAWRGKGAPPDAAGLIARLRGDSKSPVASEKALSATSS